MFFDNWFGLLRVLIVGTAAYASLVLLLRVSGNRTLAKLNAFDLVVTVALGSTLATVLLTKSVALLEGVAAFVLLAGLQYAVARLSVRYPWFNAVVKTEPVLLLHRGHFLESTMRTQRITRAEIMAALRSAGVADVSAVTAVVLETDGGLSVVGGVAGAGGTSTLEGITTMDDRRL